MLARQPLADPDEPEAARLVQRSRRGVVGEHVRLHGPEAGGIRPSEELLEQRPPDPAAARGGGDIDGVLRDAAVALAP